MAAPTRNAALPEPLRKQCETCTGAGEIAGLYCPICEGLGRVVDRSGTSPFTAKAITVRPDQPTADVIQQHITVIVSVEKSDGTTLGSINAELSRTYLDLDYSQAGYDPTDGECDAIKVYFCERGRHVIAKATPERLAGGAWRIWLEVEEVSCGE